MVNTNGSRTQGHRGADDFVSLEGIQSQSYPNYVDNGIDGPHLMKMDLIHRHIVDFGFRRCNLFENCQSIGCSLLTKPGLNNGLNDRTIMAVLVNRGCILDHIKLQGRYAPLVNTVPVQRVRLQLQLRQLLFDVIPVSPCIYKSSQGHVAGDTGKAIQIHDFHGYFAFFSIFCWMTPAA